MSADKLRSSAADDWKILDVTIESMNTYAHKDGRIEDTVRSTRKDSDITVCTQDKDTTGEYSFSVGENLQRQIDQAITLSKRIRNPSYPFAQPAATPKVRLADPIIRKAFHSHKADTVSSCHMKKLTEAFNSLPINLNQIELHLSSSDAHLQNSRGVDVRTQKTNAFLQIVVTTEGSSGEQEYLYSQNFGALKQIDPEQIAACCATMVRDQADAVTTKSFSGPVLLSGPALTEFFSPHIDLSPLIAHASARLAHMQLSSYRKGRPILKSTKGDRLTLISNPLIPFNPGSSRFDADGVPSRILTLVDRGMFCGWFASQRYAHYLDVPATGSLGCIQVGLGSRAESSLRDGCYAEVVSLSSFTPNSISGDFSAEVRLGYFHKNGKKYPFRGGLFSGNVFDLMKHVYFSNSPITADGYCGPSLVRFEKGIISGE